MSSVEIVTSLSGAIVSRTCVAVWPAGAMRSIFAGTSTVRPAESVNVRVSFCAA